MKPIVSAWRPLALAAAVSAAAAAAAAATDVFELPALQDRFLALKRDMVVAMRANDSAAMEEACRAGRALLPDDPTFAYNLACALALQGLRDDALETLREAVTLGFRDVDHIRRDPDLATLRAHPAFEAVLKQAGQPPAQDAPRRLNDATPLTVVPGGAAAVTATNTVWDFDNGLFKTFFKLELRTNDATAVDAYKGPARTLLAAWLREGRAAGNAGDLYDNRDSGHSRLNAADFPGLARVVYGAEPIRAATKPHYGAAMFAYNLPTIGNSSTALTQGPFWRSQPRMLIVNPVRAAGLFQQYLSNHIYFYPAHVDFVPANGDVFPFNAPYYIVSKGSSGTDQPFLRAVAATLAAFTPETKEILVQSRLLAPTVQMILRATQRPVTNAEAYFTGLAHPPVFVNSNLNDEAMVQLAHGMTSNTVPPLVTLRVLKEAQPLHGVDFFDAFPSAGLYDSPALIARVFRGLSWSHTLTVGANAAALPVATNLTWRWALLQGDPEKVTIRPLGPSGQTAEITVAYHKPRFPSASEPTLPSSRVDIGAFAHNGTHPSAPAILSFYFLGNERRVYDETDHRILEVEYGAPGSPYTDPSLSCRRQWKDVYTYDARKRMTGWTRSRGALQESFTAHGLLVETRDDRDRARTARSVRYLPRSSADPQTLPDLVQVTDDKTFTYSYASDEDTIGRPVVTN